MTPGNGFRPRYVAYLAVILSALLALAAATTSASSPVPQAGTAVAVEAPAATGPLLNYQGRLVDPSTGSPKSGTFPMTFKLYDVSTGGAALWMETKNVAATSGLFSTLLGDTTALNLAAFDGRDLWLGVQVSTDLEATPRIRVAYAPYALYSSNAAALAGRPPDAYAGAVHNHSAADITSGLLDEHRYHAFDSLALDGFLANAAGDLAQNNGAVQATLNADLLDGRSSADFAMSSHNHDASAITSGILPTDRFSAYTDLAAEAKIGEAPGQVAAGNHVHDTRYYAKSEADTRFVNKAGDTMSGTLAVPRIAYTAPRTQYFVVGGEGFVPGSNVPYVNTYGNGGAYIVSGSGALVAPVHLPQGAQVTEFKVFFYDVSPSDMIVYLDGQGMSGGYFGMAEVSSAGISGYGSSVTTSIGGNPIVNTLNSYCIYAFSNAWDGGSLLIKGALITYTISEAP